MAPKRTAATSAGAAAKKAKVAEPKVVKEPFVEACDDIIALLAADNSLDATSIDTLRVSAPLAFKVPKAERHEFQNTVTAHIADRLKQIEDAKKQEIAATETSIAEVEAEQIANEAALKQVNGKEDALKQALEASGAAAKEATKAVAAAKEVHVKAQQAVGSMDAEQERHVAQKAEREKLIAEVWAQLKAGNIPGRLREKNKYIEGICKILKEGGVETSCILALPLALKEKPEQRGLIAQKCLELVDWYLNKTVEDLNAEIGGHSDRVAEKTKVVDEAAAEMEKAQQLQEAKETEMIAAQNAHVDATEEIRKLKQSAKALASNSKSLAKTLNTLKGENTVIQSTVTRFNAIAEGGEAAANVQPLETETPTTAETEMQPVPVETETKPAPVEAETQPAPVADAEMPSADAVAQQAEEITTTAEVQPKV